MTNSDDGFGELLQLERDLTEAAELIPHNAGSR